MNYSIVLFNVNGLGMTIKEFKLYHQAKSYAVALKEHILVDTTLYLELHHYDLATPNEKI